MPETDTDPTEAVLEIGRRLKAARIAAGFPTVQLAALASGRQRERLSKYENGKAAISLGTLLHLIRTLRLDPADLIPESRAWAGLDPHERFPEGHPIHELAGLIRGPGRPRGPDYDPDTAPRRPEPERLREARARKRKDTA